MSNFIQIIEDLQAASAEARCFFFCFFLAPEIQAPEAPQI